MDIRQPRREQTAFADTVDSKDLVGKRVIAEDGDYLGKIKSLRINPKDMTIQGIEVDTGVFEPNKYIDRHDIHSMREDAITVTVTPLQDMKGLTLYDYEGKEVGKITDVHRTEDTNNVRSVTVRTDEGETDVDIDYILSCRDSCVLKEHVTYERR